uniref:NAD(P)H-quinone oxidoreductase subunit 6, chloroplastic n=1 Tax=Nephroselmis astigmatica TaxID=259378 RepID=A0A088CJB0_9CHLO|nr:subunit 6 of NADH-plastoquinone oxidoreductase [Nephroselmis astigmatica]AID67681.1 subunit 6 of NADH-plastoquinone oxidoreductase [Nephroselmis astigmatica]
MNISQTFQTICYFILGTGILAGGLGVILFPSIVYSAFLLGGVLFGVAGIYILLNADFLAAVQILVYVGAINILILFAIMLIPSQPELARDPGKNSLAGLVCLGSLLGLGRMIQTTPWITPPFHPDPITVPLLGGHIFSDFLLPFEVISILLLVALVGAIVLARRDLESNSFDL